MICVEVVYAAPERQVICRLEIPVNSNARQAVLASRLTDKFPDLDLLCCELGIFGKRLQNPETYVLQAGQRIEIYRPLLIDPKETRRRRAAQRA